MLRRQKMRRWMTLPTLNPGVDMFQTWLVLSIAALLIWGSWGVFANLTSRYLGGYSALVWEVAGAMVVGLVVLGWLIRNGGLETPVRGASFGILTGVTYTIGLGFLFLALTSVAGKGSGPDSGGNVHTIIVLTALYPVIAVALNYLILSEPVSPRQLLGMGIGLVGIAILVTGR
jgi:bacterial/archaeal transporter family protein